MNFLMCETKLLKQTGLEMEKTPTSPFHSLFPFKIIHTNAYSHKHIFVRLSVLTKNNDIYCRI